MSLDYEKIGLMAGIEIHQQLNTGKLFCRTPSIVRDDIPHSVVKRWLRASAGETGEVDKAAKAEMAKQKYYLYESYDDTISLVELDEEPPQDMDPEALNVVLQFAKMCGCSVVDVIAIMRKTVVDGSNTSGFQRTALVGMDGALDVSGCKVNIDTLCIEEDAAKIVEQTPEFTRYNLSKLGIPLIEIATGPDMRTPQQVYDVCAHIGMMLRSTGKVRRGIGTIRQDVNVSVKGGTRIEIKGAQDLKLIKDWVENEALRQLALIDVQKQLPQQLAIEKNFVDVSELLKKCDSKIIQGTFEKKGIILAVRLPHFAGLVGKELVPGRRLGTEFSDYAKVAAGVGGIFHSDELPKYGITEEHVALLQKQLGCEATDAFVLVAAKPATAHTALHAVVDRALQCAKGVPGEVRKPRPDGTTSYMRPMPGAARMYPETDCRVVTPDLSSVTIPKLLNERKEEMKKEYGLTADQTNALFKAEREELFVTIATKCKKLKSSFIAETLIAIEAELEKKHKVSTEGITDAHYVDVLSHIDAGELPKDALADVLLSIVKTGTYDLSQFKEMSDDDLRAAIQKVLADNSGAPQNALVGKVMNVLRGKASGKRIVELTKEMIDAQ